MNAESIETKLLKVNAAKPEAEKIAVAAEILRQGGVVAFPTETVYGLGADALNPAAVAKIFTAKGRPGDNPLIVHVADIAEVGKLVSSISPVACTMMRTFWPGPLTLILPRREIVPDAVTAGLETVAIRMPDHPVALALIRAAGVPVAAPSANLSGKPSPTRAIHVQVDLMGKVDAIIDGGDTGIGVESTVLDMTAERPLILRPGGLTLERLQMVLPEVGLDPGIMVAQEETSVLARSPGVKYKHYAPQAEVLVVEGEAERQPETIRRLAEDAEAKGKRVGIIATEENAYRYGNRQVIVSGSRREPLTIAHNLFSIFREMDAEGKDMIIAEGIDDKDLGMAVMNRLRKASGFRIVKVH